MVVYCLLTHMICNSQCATTPPPSSLRSGHPVFLTYILLSLMALFKSYPSVGDLALPLALLPLWSHTSRCECTHICSVLHVFPQALHQEYNDRPDPCPCNYMCRICVSIQAIYTPLHITSHDSHETSSCIPPYRPALYSGGAVHVPHCLSPGSCTMVPLDTRWLC